MINKTLNKIAFLGPCGTYCEEAKNLFGEKFGIKESIPLSSIKKVIEFTRNTPDTAGVIPIENSIEGVVRETMDNLLKVSGINITAETVIEINHCLICAGDDISRIKKVYSHPQALAQCHNTLETLLLSGYETIETSSTGRAIHDLTRLDDTCAAIGNELAAKSAGFNILKYKINDEPDNKTRFVFISPNTAPPTGCDRTSIVFSTKNEAGALVKVLNVFDELKLNLCYIDSRPSKKNLGEYVFFADFEAHIEEEKSQKALNAIKKHTNFVKVLGSYEHIKA